VSGLVITILSAKGGSGKTTFANNLAVVLSNRGASRVCLVDLDLALGDVARSLGLVPSTSMMSAVSADGHLEVALLPSLLTSYVDQIDCLLAPAGPGEAEKIPAGFIEELLAALRSRYDYVVVDTPSLLSSRVLAALDSSDHHVLLTNLEFPALERVRLTMDVLDQIRHRGVATSIVLNRADADGTLTDTEIDNIVRSPIAARLPHSPAVGASINQREPLAISDADHPVVAAVRAFAVSHLGLRAGRALTSSAPLDRTTADAARLSGDVDMKCQEASGSIRDRDPPDRTAR
jgi:pilus assembly protein CpaE